VVGRVKRLSLSVLAIAFSTAALLVVLEFALRALQGPSLKHPKFGCLAAAKEAGQTMIVFLGGSTVWGAPSQQLGFVQQFTDALKKREQAEAIAVCNVAEPGRDSSGVLIDFAETLRFHPDLVVVLTGHNEFLSRFYQPVWLRMLREWADRLAMVAMLRRVDLSRSRSSPTSSAPDAELSNAAGLSYRFSTLPQEGLETARVMPPNLLGVDREGWNYRARVRRYEANIRRIVAMADASGTSLVIGTVASNIRDWPPAYRTLSPEDGGVLDAAAVDDVRYALLNANVIDAETIFEGLSDKDKKSPVGRFLRLKLNEARGAVPDLSAFVAVKDDDPIPWRALERFNEVVRAAAEGSISLIDTDRLLVDHAAEGIPGTDLFADNCHPSPWANRLIAEALLHHVAVGLNLESSSGADEGARDRLDEFMQSVNDPIGTRLEYHLRNAKYSMKVPFYNFIASRQSLELAKTLAPNDWRVWGNLATVSLLEGKLTEGRGHLVKARAFAPAGVDFLSREHSPYLVEALQIADNAGGGRPE